MELKDSVTRENLLRAFAGESQARNRYTFAASACRKAGLQLLEAVFLYTAGQEKEHGEVFYGLLARGGCDSAVINGAEYPIDRSEDPLRLLELARDHELAEYGDIYPAFAAKAREEGFEDAARRFDLIAEIENVHARRFERFAQLLRENRLFTGEAETGWICLNCGHVLTGRQAPQKCPVCDHDQGYFIRLPLSPYET